MCQSLLKTGTLQNKISFVKTGVVGNVSCNSILKQSTTSVLTTPHTFQLEMPIEKIVLKNLYSYPKTGSSICISN